jgi:hypothetical protein
MYAKEHGEKGASSVSGTREKGSLPVRSSALAIELANSMSTVLVIPNSSISFCPSLDFWPSLMMYPVRLLNCDSPRIRRVVCWRQGKSITRTAWKQGRMTTREAAMIVTLNSRTITRCVGIISPDDVSPWRARCRTTWTYK